MNPWWAAIFALDVLLLFVIAEGVYCRHNGEHRDLLLDIWRGKVLW